MQHKLHTFLFILFYVYWMGTNKFVPVKNIVSKVATETKVKGKTIYNHYKSCLLQLKIIIKPEIIKENVYLKFLV